MTIGFPQICMQDVWTDFNKNTNSSERSVITIIKPEKIQDVLIEILSFSSIIKFHRNTTDFYENFFGKCWYLFYVWSLGIPRSLFLRYHPGTFIAMENPRIHSISIVFFYIETWHERGGVSKEIHRGLFHTIEWASFET